MSSSNYLWRQQQQQEMKKELYSPVEIVDSLGMVYSIPQENPHFIGITNSLILCVDSRNRSNIWSSPDKFTINLPYFNKGIFSIELIQIIIQAKQENNDPYIILKSKKLQRQIGMKDINPQDNQENYSTVFESDVFGVIPTRNLYENPVGSGKTYYYWKRDGDGHRIIKRFYPPECKLNQFDIFFETFTKDAITCTHRYPMNYDDVVYMEFEIVALQ